jgi:hypothetical protein
MFDAGHFALDTAAERIAQLIRAFLAEDDRRIAAAV